MAVYITRKTFYLSAIDKRNLSDKSSERSYHGFHLKNPALYRGERDRVTELNKCIDDVPIQNTR